MAQSQGASPLVLASASPRRLDLLQQIGVEPARVVPAELDERPRRGELPAPHALRLAEEKARTVAALHPGAYVLAADTVVACGRRILPKAETEAQTRACLHLLSGRRHRVHGGVCVLTPDGRMAKRLVTTIVTFKNLSPAEIDTYIAGNEWHGKAGGYAIQGRAAVFVRHLNGSYANVVGLPVYEVNLLLEGLGFHAHGRD